jgi:membrane glycosyltransferase
LRSAARYGGVAQLALSSLVETLFIFLLVPIEWFTQALAMGALLLGRTIHWDAPQRDRYRVRWRAALEHLWPHTLFGAALVLVPALTAPSALLWFLPFAAGLLLSIPFAVLTSTPAFGRFAVRHRLCAIPEEIDVLPEIAAVMAKPKRAR